MQPKNSRTAFSAATPERQPPRHKSPNSGNCLSEEPCKKSGSRHCTPGLFRRLHETSRTELHTPLGLTYRASEETHRFELTSGLPGDMNEFRRLKARCPSATSRGLAEFMIFAKAVAGFRQKPGGWYVREDRGGEYREVGAGIATETGKNGENDKQGSSNTTQTESRSPADVNPKTDKPTASWWPTR